MIASICFLSAHIAALFLMGIAVAINDWQLAAMGAVLTTLAAIAQWITRRG
jgi:hypothetical protein